MKGSTDTWKSVCCNALIVIATGWALAQDAQAQKWNWEKLTLPLSYDRGFYLDIMFLSQNPQYGWACGFGGNVLRTTDGGTTWEGTRIPNADQLESIMFVNERVGYCSGTNNGNPNFGGIYRSVDGGRSWQEITPVLLVNGVLQRAPVWGCYFLTETLGMVVGGGCAGLPQMFFRTTDGGQSWEAYFANEPETGMSHVLMYDANGLCYASSSGRIWRSLDGGRSWQIFAVTGPPYWQENLANEGNTFLVGTAGTTCTGSTGTVGDIRWSLDQGRSWSLFSTGASIFGTFLLNESVGWAAGWNRAVYRFWRDQITGQAMLKPYRCGLEPWSNFDDIWFINDTLGFVVGDGIYRTTQRDLLEPIVVSSTGQFLICDGQPITLSVLKGDRIRQPYSEYRWSTGATTPTLTVAQAGTYWVEVRDQDECYGKSVEVMVADMPSPKAAVQVIAPTPLCEGDTIRAVVLLDSSQVGIADYYWVGMQQRTEQVIVVAKGGDILEFQVLVRGINGCESLSNKVVLSVKLRPQPIITVMRPLMQRDDGALVLCPGEEVQLEAPIGYARYRWSTGETARIITVREAGTYTVTVAANEQDPTFSSCEGTSLPVTIVIGDTVKPTILSQRGFRFCDGDELVLHTEKDYAEYRWSTGATSPSITITTAGEYWVEVTDRFGCRGRSGTVRVEVDPNPIAIVGVGGRVWYFDTTAAHAMRCDSLLVRNTGDQPLILGYAHLQRNIEFSIPLAQLPITILPGQEHWVVACFLPSTLGEQRDTLTLSDDSDYCKQELELIGICSANTYQAIAGCGVQLSGSTVSFSHEGLLVVPPYPQPASEQVQLIVRGQSVHVELRSAIAGESRLFQCEVEGAFVRCTCDVTTVPSGVYVVQLHADGSTVMLPVVIVR